MDSWIVNKLDALMLALQKRGVSLVSIRCCTITAVLFTDVAGYILQGKTKQMLIFGFVWSVFCAGRYVWASDAHNYRENWRTAQRLNAMVLEYRDQWKVRAFFGGGLLMLVIAVDVPKAFGGAVDGIMDAVTAILVIIDQYLFTSTYLTGLPRAKTEHSTDTATQRI